MPIYTVSQISEAIKKTLEGSFPTLQIKGEISNLRHQSSGHIYFTLKDEGAQLSCALFRMDASKLKVQLKDGDQVVASGNISVFPPKGGYQLIVKHIETQGLGELLLRFEALKKKFQAAGYFESARKKQLPLFPKTIGVVTSPTGAVIQDIIHTLSRRHKGFKLVLIPTKVQGDGAKEEIVSAINYFNEKKLCDVMIVGRGGGSLEDLWCFNQPEVVEAIYRSKIPVISAVGHETDFTLCDFVADLRAPTPTAASEMVLPQLSEVLKQILFHLDSIKKIFIKRIKTEKLLITQLKKRPEFLSSGSLLQGYILNLDRIESKLKPTLEQILRKKRLELSIRKATLQKFNPLNSLKQKKLLLDNLKMSLYEKQKKKLIVSTNLLTTFKNQNKQVILKILDQKKGKLELILKLLSSLNPLSVLDKGYAIIYREDNSSVITKIYDISEKQDLRIQLKDGSVHVKVKQTSLI